MLVRTLRIKHNWFGLESNRQFKFSYFCEPVALVIVIVLACSTFLRLLVDLFVLFSPSFLSLYIYLFPFPI